MDRDILISVKDLKKHFPIKRKFGGKKEVLKAVDGVTLDIKRGETFGLVGESGCGKSTLGKTIIRMHEVTSGSIEYDGRDITRLMAGNLSEIQNKMQIIFQDSYSAMNPFWNVREILSEPLKRTGKKEKECIERIEYLLKKVGMKSDDMEKFPHEFSGGQRQRIGIARALTVNPEFIMCDEPLASLDVCVQANVVNMLEDLQKEFGLTYIFAAHDLSMVKYISDRIAVMYAGKIVELASSDELYKNPLHPYTKALLSAIPIAKPGRSEFISEHRYDVYDSLQNIPELREVSDGHFLAI